MRVFAAREYLSLYNDTWRKADDPIIDQAEFCARLTDPSIVLYDEVGTATIFFEDSDMFAGHSVEVSLNGGKIDYASMAG